MTIIAASIALVFALAFLRPVFARLFEFVSSRSPQPFLGDDANAEWAERMQAELASGAPAGELNYPADPGLYADYDWSAPKQNKGGERPAHHPSPSGPAAAAGHEERRSWDDPNEGQDSQGDDGAG